MSSGEQCIIMLNLIFSDETTYDFTYVDFTLTYNVLWSINSEYYVKHFFKFMLKFGPSYGCWFCTTLLVYGGARQLK
jgi:hypothetical protein